MKICPRCKLPLIDGLALDNSYSSSERGYMTPVSSGKMIKCFKCPVCGHSEIEEIPNNQLPPISEWSEQDRKTFEEFCEWGRKNCK
jgi:hypothetical protein